MEQKAQGAIEYLLIIGAAILVVAIVIIALSGVLTGATEEQGDMNDLNDAKEKLKTEGGLE
ncbi:MAG: class III signal peptide [Candidatus ainarchaeum sp.]|nr:class III signal peptide [Candidatus ainarchaeum sp.]MDD4128157.1 class III signal peptide [Candidatus ainarchaeum sp.]